MVRGAASTRSWTKARPTKECRLAVAAVLEKSTHTSGIGWRLTTPSGPGPIGTATHQQERTLIAAELAAVRKGLIAALRERCRRLRIRVPRPATARVLAEEEPLAYRRATRAAHRMKPLIDQFEWLRVEPSVSDDHELNLAVARALDAGLHRAAEREELREQAVERVMERARSVRLEERDGRWIANGRYRVQLDPMQCECPAWTARWARTPLPGRRARRLPCKHVVALALRHGITVPSQLMAMARRAAT